MIYTAGLVMAAASMAAAAVGQTVRARRALALHEAEAHHLANHDVLTGLPNLRNANARLAEMEAKAHASGGHIIAAVIDIDQFKEINDTLGRAAGDVLLQAVALRMRQLGGDCAARIGGDEFALLRLCDAPGAADELTLQIMAAFAPAFEVEGHSIDVSASVGIAISDKGGALTNLLRNADIAVSEAKERNRGGTVRFTQDMARRIELRRALQMDLKNAIGKGELTLHYQPIVEAATWRISSVEALLRWTSPRHGNVPPSVFIPIAEETGLMAELGRFVIDQAVRDSKRWSGIATSINISAAQLRSASVLQDLMEPTRVHGVSPAGITLEITESMLMGKDERTLRTLNILKDAGFSLALDDFGTGYSNLAYIRDFPFDRLKIDRAFVTALGNTSRALEIIRAIVGLGRILGREVVAEGIETDAELLAVQAAGVTHIQGFYFHRPMSAAHLEALLASEAQEKADEAEPVSARPHLRSVA